MGALVRQQQADEQREATAEARRERYSHEHFGANGPPAVESVEVRLSRARAEGTRRARQLSKDGGVQRGPTTLAAIEAESAALRTEIVAERAALRNGAASADRAQRRLDALSGGATPPVHRKPRDPEADDIDRLRAELYGTTRDAQRLILVRALLEGQVGAGAA